MAEQHESNGRSYVVVHSAVFVDRVCHHGRARFGGMVETGILKKQRMVSRVVLCARRIVGKKTRWYASKP